VENTQASRKRAAQGKPVKSGFKKPSLDDMGPGTDMAKPLFRKNTLDEMTVGRTEKPLGTGKLPRKPGSVPAPASDEPEARSLRAGEDNAAKPLKRGKIGVGSYEDPADQRAAARRPKKSGRPGR
jgi:excinuclease ABC subunit B